MTKLLTREEEFDLSQKISRGNAAQAVLDAGDYEDTKKLELLREVKVGKDAYQEFFNKNMALVASLAHKTHLNFSSALDMEDLIQSGCIGLMNAISKFDPSQGNKFSTMATWWIKQSINRSVNNTARLVRLPENRINQLIKINQIRSECKSFSEYEIREIIKAELDITDKDIDVIQSAAETPSSLNAPISSSSENDGREYQDILAENSVDPSTPDLLVTSSSLKEELVAIVGSIGEKESDVLLSFFDIEYNGRLLKEEEVQEKYDMSRPTYRYRAIRQALKKVRKVMEEKNYSMDYFADIS